MAFLFSQFILFAFAAQTQLDLFLVNLSWIFISKSTLTWRISELLLASYACQTLFRSSCHALLPHARSAWHDERRTLSSCWLSEIPELVLFCSLNTIVVTLRTKRIIIFLRYSKLLRVDISVWENVTWCSLVFQYNEIQKSTNLML